MQTWNSSLILGNQDSPVNEVRDVWKGSCDMVEFAEPMTALGVLGCSGWR
jgi:hypothetical protein